VNIATQKSALNTWICVIVRRAAVTFAGAAGLDASGTGTVAPTIVDSCAAMIAASKPRENLLIMRRRPRNSQRAPGSQR
jgi:hypothetical protein